MAIAWSRISSKVIANPPSADEACRRRCGNGHSCSDTCIPHMVDRRKREVLGACDAEGTPRPQTRGGMCHVRLGLLHAAKTLTAYRSTRCQHAYATPNNSPKPDGAVIAQPRSVSHVTAVRRNTLPRLSSRRSMSWG